MPLPKYTKITKNGVEYIDGSDRAQYAISELSRAAMRDVGKLITKRARTSYYSIFNRRKGAAGRDIQYWVPRTTESGKAVDVAYLYVGFKRGIAGFFASFQERGTRGLSARHILYNTVNDNINEIQKIEHQYLSAIEAPDDGESLIDDNETEGGADDN